MLMALIRSQSLNKFVNLQIQMHIKSMRIFADFLKRFRQICFADFASGDYPYIQLCVCVRMCIILCKRMFKSSRDIRKIYILNRTFTMERRQYLCFSSLTLKYIFHVKHFAFHLICEFLANGVRQSYHWYCHQIGSQVFAIEWSDCECCTSGHWSPTF